MSTPEGPDQPHEQPPNWQYPPQQQYLPQQYGAQQYPPPQQPYEPVIYQQPPNEGQLPPYGAEQYGPQPQYGYGGYPQSAPPPPSPNRTPVIIALVAVVVVALAVIGIVVFVGGGDSDKKQAQSPLPSPTASAPVARSAPASSSAAPTTAPASPSGNVSPTSVQQITVPSVISGWQGVLSYKENVAYDVPPDWKIETPGTLVGFESSTGQPVAIMHGVSTYKDEACPAVSGSYRGHTGFKTAGDIDPAASARSGLKTFADGIALKDDGSLAPIATPTVKTIKVDQGKIDATYARTTVTVNGKTSDCGSPTVAVVAVAFRTSASETALFIGYFDQGVADALPLSTAEKIFTSLRPYQK